MALISFIAGENVTAGNVVYVNPSGVVFKASAIYSSQASLVGVALDSVSTGDLVRVNNDSLYSNFSNLIPGETRYLSVLTSGSLTSYSGFVNEIENTALAGAYLTTVGRVVTTSGVEIETDKPVFIDIDSVATPFMLLETSPFLSNEYLLLEDNSIIQLEST